MKMLNYLKKNIFLCAPFIKKDIVKSILNNINAAIDLNVITSSNIAAFFREASDLEAIELLLKNNVKVYNHQNLHAKIYIFDESKALITSANLTYSGLSSNYEYGLLISRDPLINNVISDFMSLINDPLSGRFDLNIVDEIKNQIRILKINNTKTKADNVGDDILILDYNIISKMLTSWKKDVFDIIYNLNDHFSIQDVYNFENELKAKHQNNNNIRAIIRQILQQLRDLGIIKFEKPGQYKKYFK